MKRQRSSSAGARFPFNNNHNKMISIQQIRQTFFTLALLFTVLMVGAYAAKGGAQPNDDDVIIIPDAVRNDSPGSMLGGDRSAASAAMLFAALFATLLAF